MVYLDEGSVYKHLTNTVKGTDETTKIKLRQVKAWVERLKRPPTENAKILFNDTERSE